MNQNTKLNKLKEYTQREFFNWREEFGKGLIGVGVGKKEKSGQLKRNYSIVFSVKKKGDDFKKEIPKYMEIEIEKDNLIRVPTDVKESGETQLNVQYGDQAKPTSLNSPGTLGLFLRRNGQIYGCSNMHVLGDHILANGFTTYHMPVPYQTDFDSIFLASDHYVYGCLEEGIFGDIDAAISRIMDTSLVNNSIPGYGVPGGIQYLNWSNYSINVVLYGNVSGSQASVVRYIGQMVHFNHRGWDAFPTDLMLIDKVSTSGDSGAIVFNPFNMRVIGMLIGSTDHYSCVIPIHKILSNFNASLL